jgi:enediyne biosynthesis protein CalE5
MLTIGKERAASLGLQNIMEFREADAETIDLSALSFNAVISWWGLMFLPNSSGALNIIHRTLVPDGYLAAAVWGYS